MNCPLRHSIPYIELLSSKPPHSPRAMTSQFKRLRVQPRLPKLTFITVSKNIHNTHFHFNWISKKKMMTNRTGVGWNGTSGFNNFQIYVLLKSSCDWMHKSMTTIMCFTLNSTLRQSFHQTTITYYKHP